MLRAHNHAQEPQLCEEKHFHHSQMWVAPGKIAIMKSLIFLAFILSPILISAQTYENEDESGKVTYPKYVL